MGREGGLLEPAHGLRVALQLVVPDVLAGVVGHWVQVEVEVLGVSSSLERAAGFLVHREP